MGGGRFRVELTPTPRSKLRFLLLNHRGGFKRKEVHSVFAGHSFRYGKEQARRLIEAMQWSEVSYYLDEWESDCPGMVLTVLLQSDHITECFTSIANPRQVSGRGESDWSSNSFPFSSLLVVDFLSLKKFDAMLLVCFFRSFRKSQSHR